ncbi:MAG TPA: type II toxin-antitoxin system VapC family toxin [Chloroflexota bacterium]|nr:type II toxin-antitoxin system VapC family toxin [Chloroflexota bacterium]
MSEVVLDASVLIKWFRAQGERHREAALALYGQFARGALLVVVPPLLFLELLNVAARRWGWEIERLERFAADLGRIGLVVRQPTLGRVAHWCGQGLTAYDACYVALAEERRTVVVTDDERLLAVAGGLARPLVRAGG